MLEICWHARGGQGPVTAAKALAEGGRSLVHQRLCPL